MEKNQIRVGDKCRVCVDWGDGSNQGKTCQVVKFQKNGTGVFAVVRWLGNNANQLKSDFGTLFEPCDLRKV